MRGTFVFALFLVAMAYVGSGSAAQARPICNEYTVTIRDTTDQDSTGYPLHDTIVVGVDYTYFSTPATPFDHFVNNSIVPVSSGHGAPVSVSIYLPGVGLISQGANGTWASYNGNTGWCYRVHVEIDPATGCVHISINRFHC